MKILAFCMDGVEEVELLGTVDLLRRSNFIIDIVNIEDKDYSISSHNVKIGANYKLSEVDYKEYDAVFLPGGPGYKKYDDYKIKEIINYYYNNNKYIFAICAAPSILAKMKILQNRKATVFNGLENILMENGTNYINDYVVKDGKIITARSVASIFEFSLKIIEEIKGMKARKDIEEMIIY